MDITPRVPKGRQLVEAYGDGGFRIAGIAWRGSVLVFPDRTQLWPVPGIAAIDRASLNPVREAVPAVELLLVGCGPEIAPVPADLRLWLKEAGIAMDRMDTGAACRTYNVLLAEDRRIAAALIAVE